jgi:hypothetical protein
VKRHVAFLAAVAALTVGAWTVSAATPNVGQHIHALVANHPIKGKVIPRAPWTFQVTVQLHDMPAKATLFRVADSSTVKQTRQISVGPCADCQTSFAFTVDFSKWTCGEHELRWTANVPSQSGSDRQYTTSRSYVTLAGCTTKRHERPADWYVGGGGWYEDYSIGIFQTPEANIRAGQAVRMRVQSAADKGCLYRNPDFHGGSHGLQIGACWTGTSTVTRTIPSDTVNGDRIVLVSQDSPDQAGPVVVTVGDAADGIVTQHVQSWWASPSLVIP